MLQHRASGAFLCGVTGVALTIGAWGLAVAAPDRAHVLLVVVLPVAVLLSAIGVIRPRARSRSLSENAPAPAAAEPAVALSPPSAPTAEGEPRSVEDWRSAFDALGEGVWEWFPATGSMQFSRGWRTMLGCSDDEIPDTVESWAERIHPEDWVRTLDDMESHLAGTTDVYENEHRARCGDGSYKWVHDRGVVLARDAEGAPVHLLGVRTDISVRKELEDQLWRQAVEISNANEQLAEMAITDALTGLRNRRGFMRLAEDERDEAENSGTNVALVFLDIDHFKRINDTYGHEAGDIVLKEIGRRLVAGLGARDLPGRIGGEEFAILLPEVTCVEAERVADSLRRAIADTGFILSDGREIAVSASFGVTCCSAGGGLSTLLSRADMALYEAKSAGRNRVRVVCPSHASSAVGAAAE